MPADLAAALEANPPAADQLRGVPALGAQDDAVLGRDRRAAGDPRGAHRADHRQRRAQRARPGLRSRRPPRGAGPRDQLPRRRPGRVAAASRCRAAIRTFRTRPDRSVRRTPCRVRATAAPSVPRRPSRSPMRTAGGKSVRATRSSKASTPVAVREDVGQPVPSEVRLHHGEPRGMPLVEARIVRLLVEVRGIDDRGSRPEQRGAECRSTSPAPGVRESCART